MDNTGQRDPREFQQLLRGERGWAIPSVCLALVFRGENRVIKKGVSPSSSFPHSEVAACDVSF